MVRSVFFFYQVWYYYFLLREIMYLGGMGQGDFNIRGDLVQELFFIFVGWFVEIFFVYLVLLVEISGGFINIK